MPAPGVGLWTPRSSEEQHGRRRDRPRNHSRRRIAPSLAPSVAGLARDLQAHLCDERLSQSVADGRRRRLLRRLEEHTSELQSLMRISYAVFCLQTKTFHTTIVYTSINLCSPN